MRLRCEKQMIKAKNRYNILRYKSTTSNSPLPNISVGSELAGSTTSEIRLSFGLQCKLKIIMNPSVTEGEKREASDQINIKFDHL